MKKSIYDYLGWIAVVAVPIAPVFFFAHKIYNVAYAMANSFWLALGVGLVSAIGLEIVGIYAGHTTMEFWRRGDNTRAVISGLIMLAYVGIGVYELWGTVGVVMFIIAPLVYVLLALQEMLKVEDGKEAGAITFEQNEKKADSQFKRDMIAERQRLKHELALEQMRASTAKAQAEPVLAAPMQEPARTSYECEDCNRGFSTVQALNAHGRFCKGVRVLNGVSK